MSRICVFGEPLLELATTEAGDVLGPARLGMAGDTLNTSVYLSRLGHDVQFITALGSDRYSAAMIARMNDEGIATDHVLKHPSRLPGLYAIRTDEQGERYFTYWRDQSAARDFFALADASLALASALESDLFYFSGISLAILPPAQRGLLLALAHQCKQKGVRVAFDGNYRPYGWQSPEEARDCLAEVGRTAAVVLPTSEDDDRLFGAASPVEHARRWQALGVTTVAVKNGADGAWVIDGTSAPLHVPVETPVQPIDTTGAGDSFNAAFLAALLNEHSPQQCARLGNRLAGRVIQRRGALIDASDMP